MRARGPLGLVVRRPRSRGARHGDRRLAMLLDGIEVRPHLNILWRDDAGLGAGDRRRLIIDVVSQVVFMIVRQIERI